VRSPSLHEGYIYFIPFTLCPETRQRGVYREAPCSRCKKTGSQGVTAMRSSHHTCADTDESRPCRVGAANGVLMTRGPFVRIRRSTTQTDGSRLPTNIDSGLQQLYTKIRKGAVERWLLRRLSGIHWGECSKVTCRDSLVYSVQLVPDTSSLCLNFTQIGCINDRQPRVIVTIYSIDCNPLSKNSVHITLCI